MHFKTRSYWCFALLAITTVGKISAVQSLPQNSPAVPAETPTVRLFPEYVLGPGDQINITAVDAEEISNKPIRISATGDISLNTVGRIHAAGKTIRELEAELVDRLKAFIIRPDVTVAVTESRSQPVTVVGAVQKPGPVQLEGRKTLLEVLSLAGGTPNEASSIIKISRDKEWGPLPLPSMTTPSGSIAEVNITALHEGKRPEENIQILPYDLITVPKAPVVYVIGQVNKQGTFILSNQSTVSMLTLIAMAGGETPTANVKEFKVMRQVPDATRLEITVNYKDIKSGKIKDVMMQPDDILLVPENNAKRLLQGTFGTIIQMLPGLAIYRF
jgi:polysaccharide export outer membrane protein